MPGKKGFKYVYSADHINHILKKITETGRPDKLTMPYLRDTWLLKNAQYSAVLDILRDMDFIDSSGVPTSLYAEYQNPAKAKKALAKGIKNAYSQLFKAYPNAYSLDKVTLDGYIKQHTGAEKAVLDKISKTFRSICSLAEFNGEGPEEVDKEESKKKIGEKPFGAAETLVPITMNIQIVIPSDATEGQYDKIFSSLRKFLMK